MLSFREIPRETVKRQVLLLYKTPQMPCYPLTLLSFTFHKQRIKSMLERFKGSTVKLCTFQGKVVKKMTQHLSWPHKTNSNDSHNSLVGSSQEENTISIIYIPPHQLANYVHKIKAQSNNYVKYIYNIHVLRLSNRIIYKI